ncbi:MAG: hypothetical protein ISS69_05695 [Phycisphaerae bacterium]|nr:hypothetical protein [Planctomycetota bacterium]MBL7219584.1 hypothetical protein [Phycisphaerae bacterium]
MGVPYISREAKLDHIVSRNGDVFKGEIANKRYVVTASRGKFKIPAARVVGIVSAGEESKTLRLVLTDSQVIRGKLKDQTLDIDMSGSKLSISFGDIVECGYRVTPAKPSEPKFSGTMVSLRDGQRLLLSEFDTKLQIECDYGKADLPAASILSVNAAGEKRLGHAVSLAGGSMLSGVLAPKKWTVGLQLGGKLEIDGEKLLALTSGGVKPVKPAGGVTMKMLNGDILHGKLTAKAVGIRTEFGEVSPDAKGIMSIVVTPKGKPPAVMTMWSSAVHRGEFLDKQLSLTLSPGGPVVKVSTAKIASITWAPPK